ncbi:MAG: aminopeptidase [Candidatus Omnitrophica bacterium]|nr:aminopeptidase [Candidatus Omnitrophota bacterium]
MKKPALRSIASFILRSLFFLKPGEKFLVVTDPVLFSLAVPFVEEAERLGAISCLRVIPVGKVHGEEPPAPAGQLLYEADAAILITSFSLSHTRARKTASRHGVRIASLPNTTRDMLLRAIPVSYKSLLKKAFNIAKRLRYAKEIIVKTAKGTLIHFSKMGRREVFADTGILKDRGAFSNLPAGEVCLAPREGTASGKIVVDGSAPYLGKLRSSLTLSFKGGRLVSLGGSGSGKLWKILSSKGRKAFNLAEFGIGINPKARITGKILEDEKAVGTVHFALGNNLSFGGHVDVPLHLDFVIRSPRIFLDGKRLGT